MQNNEINYYFLVVNQHFFFFQSFYFCGNGEHGKRDLTLNDNPILKICPQNKNKNKNKNKNPFIIWLPTSAIDRNVNEPDPKLLLYFLNIF